MIGPDIQLSWCLVAPELTGGVPAAACAPLPISGQISSPCCRLGGLITRTSCARKCSSG